MAVPVIRGLPKSLIAVARVVVDEGGTALCGALPGALQETVKNPFPAVIWCRSKRWPSIKGDPANLTIGSLLGM